MSQTLNLSIHIDLAKQGTYFTLPFQVPDGVESISLKYNYPRRPETQQNITGGVFTAQPETNIVDLGMLDPTGEQVGASGSDKTEIRISETSATPGYHPWIISPGQWQILIGAYKIAPEGVNVEYDIEFTPKAKRWLKGDLHTHTIASDGVHTLEELTWKAKRNGLDFVAVTDHNQFASSDCLAEIEDVTMIPGVEWTHFQGHANFIGADKPYDGSFAANSVEEVSAKFISAHDRGALIMINHPFDPGSGFKFDINSLPYDCIEVWNGPMRESNLRAVGYWQQLLCSGKKVPACGGSDYHRDTPFVFLGGPTTHVYAESQGKSDVLAALKAGHAFISFAPDGPTCELKSGNKMMGDSLPFQENQQADLVVRGLFAGDVVRVVTDKKSEVLFNAPSDGVVSLSYKMESPGFVRVEVLRAFLPGIPMLPALITNPIYFD